MMRKLTLFLLILCLTACVKKDRVAEVPTGEDSVATAETMVVEKKKTKPRAADKLARPDAAEPVVEVVDSVEEEPAVEEMTKPETELTGVLNGHDWVDLGLSVKWATCNVGAGSPEDCGDYFAWGERKPKDCYTKENSSMTDTDVNGITGHRRRDVARVKWGEGWRMPTKAEVEELVSKCETTWAVQNGVNGRLVKNPKTGASIFLPAGGYCGSELYELGESGRYWTGTSETGDPNAEFLFFYSEQCNWHRDYRYYGLNVRPVTE